MRARARGLPHRRETPPARSLAALNPRAHQVVASRDELRETRQLTQTTLSRRFVVPPR